MLAGPIKKSSSLPTILPCIFRPP